MTCITAVRKAERQKGRKRLLAKKQASRQFRQTLQQMKKKNSVGKGKHIQIIEDDFLSDSEDEDEHRPAKKKDLGGEDTIYTSSGCLMVPTDKWSNLPEDHRTFVMDYNSKIKHKDSVKDMKSQDGFMFSTKARRMGTSAQTKTVTSEKKAETSKKKKIRFDLEQSQNSDDKDDEDE
jgi:hypothetical protein